MQALVPSHENPEGVVRVSFDRVIALGDDAFVVEPEGDAIAIDTDRDGKIDTKVVPRGATVVLRRAAGEYAVRIESILTKKGGRTATRSWLYRTGTVMKGKTASLLDVNGNGRFDERQCDALIVDGKRLPLDAQVPIRRTLWEVTVEGDTLTLRDTGEKAPVISSIRVVRMINDLRAACGLSPVTVDAELSRGCDRHVRYLQAVGYGKTKDLDAHSEDPRRAGYSAEGLAAAMNSYLGWGHGSLEDFFSSNLRTWYHRIGYVCPDLKVVGVAAGGGLAAIDVGSCRLNFQSLSSPIVLPYDGMTAAPRTYSREGPNPIEPSRDPNTCGVAIQCIFPEGAKLEAAEIFVEDATGNPVEGYLNLPGKAFSTPFALEHVVGMIPRAALAPGAKYFVTVRCRWDDKPYVREWAFTTAAP
jgi:hypothetical protein